MKELKDLKVGDPVMVTQYNRGASRDTITRAGRKYFYIGQGHLEYGYDKVTGRAHGDYSSGFIETIDHYDMRCRAILAEKELRAFGVQVSPSSCPEKIMEVRMALDVLISTWQGP